ncbi:hypothetical protein JEQ12_015956 [Ovis aries]|uniref:G-protein coupled receptors family 1 profile domain-containing protein n=1 Tax=Ovis aries TaxID=9940 RepID=A0A836A5X5_SHEEP|nr:hypothetical protein JEQ12_015956 [Ovis aries]
MDPPENLSYFTLSTPAPGETNRSSFDAADPRPSLPLLSVFGVLVLTLLGFLVAATFAWNLLVLATILRVRTFHRVPHNLMASMAISDVLVAALVIPLSLVHELSGRRWQLGRRLCQLWIACDVLCCTASIWNVTAIALDRYWSITRHLEYTLRARRRVSNVMIALTWALSAVISLAPLIFGWGETYSEGSEECQIYKAAKLRVGPRKTNSVSPISETVQVKGAAQRPEMVLATRRATVPFQADGDAWGEQKEQRAALTVGILIGVFALCWIPFFTAELLSPLRTCDSPATWKSALQRQTRKELSH